MKSRIFKSIIYTLIVVFSIHSAAKSQGTDPEKQKAMEAKMEQMEARLKAMQLKLDSLKAAENNVSSTGIGYVKAPKAIKISPRAPMVAPVAPLKSPTPPMAMGWSSSSSDAFAPNGSFSKAFSGMGKAMKSSLSDEKIQEKIKSGEIKEKVKNYNKSYPINSGDKLQIDNRYGKVTVNTWNKNEFKVDVEIRGLANDDDEAQKIIDGVTINDSKDGPVVSFTTNIDNRSNRWEIWNSNDEKTTMHIHKTVVNYTVYIPSKNPLTITNRYGNIVLPDFNGKLTINNAYGNFIAKELSNTENEISTRYSEVNIEALNGGSLSCSYGNMVKIGVANNLNLETSYVATDIAKLKTAGNISVRYGAGLKINDLDKTVKNLNINSSYAPIAVDLKSGNNFDFDITVRYNNFKYNDDMVKVTSKTPGDDERRYSSTKNYKGYVGKSNNDTKVTITTSYQPVQFL